MIRQGGWTFARRAAYLALTVCATLGVGTCVKRFYPWGLEATLSGHTANVCCVSFSPCGDFVASGADDGTAAVWDIERRRCLCVLSIHADMVSAIAFMNDGDWLATGGRDGKVAVWDWAAGIVRHALKGSTANPVYAIASIPGASRVAVGSSDGSVKIWDVIRDDVVNVGMHSAAVVSLAANTDGTLLASMSSDGVIRWWGIGDPRAITSIWTADPYGGYSLSRVAFAPNGKMIVANTMRHAVIFDVATGRKLKQLKADVRLPMSGVAFSHDGRLVWGVFLSRMVVAWRVDTGDAECVFWSRGGASLAVSPDGTRLATDGSWNQVLVWDIRRLP